MFHVKCNPKPIDSFSKPKSSEEQRYYCTLHAKNVRSRLDLVVLPPIRLQQWESGGGGFPYLTFNKAKFA